MSKYLACVAALLATAACTTTPPVETDVEAIHRDLLVLDTHLDTPLNFGRPGWDFSQAHTLENDIAQVDLGRMAAGNLDGGFFVIYTEQGELMDQGYRDALAFARLRSDTIDRELALHPDMIRPVTTAEQAEALAAQGLLFGFKSIENSYPLGESVSLLQEFYDRGVRMAGPVHSATNQFADAATGEARWNGLSPLGREWVAEMNRLGMVIDASHASDAAFDQMVDLSATPIILSHTSPRAAYDHPRNLDDARIRRLAASGGAICASTIFLSEINLDGERGELFTQYENIASMSEEKQAELVRRWRALDETQPLWDTDFETFFAALLHVIEVAGVDHVCFGADWDGGGGIEGLMEISDLPHLTGRLLEEGYTPAQIEKMTSGNVLRIVRQAQAAARR
ncbi:dipeptidase [Aurantiacibacter zhengii]|uniref:Membrane dipeptidase n=1 Tax=Aurantiacibacter zhengii TaxID=2307003 RepID=A0A418NQB1_9SPHN|nr:dipeptidase [Aurantiacibacter zhengii]RIV84994.1 membrane dipeptidase [Aurantiacibacter zhengii]